MFNSFGGGVVGLVVLRFHSPARGRLLGTRTPTAFLITGTNLWRPVSRVWAGIGSCVLRGSAPSSGALGFSGERLSKEFRLSGLEISNGRGGRGGSEVAGVDGGVAFVDDATEEGSGGGLFGEGLGEAGDGLVAFSARAWG